MQTQDEDAGTEGMVGIFWMWNGTIIIDSTPLLQAERYGDNLTHATGHLDYWSALQRCVAVPLDIGYEEAPRGRISYNFKSKEFLVLADRCIIANVDSLKAIIRAFHLPKDVRPAADDHYRCAACLNRWSRRGQEL